VSERERKREREREKEEGQEKERKGEGGGEKERESIEEEREKGRVQDMNSVNMSHVSFVLYISINSDLRRKDRDALAS